MLSTVLFLAYCLVCESDYQVSLAVGLFADISGSVPVGHLSVGRVPAASVNQSPVLRANH
jgi:hypothetical protein